jgi:hypothetical protein
VAAALDWIRGFTCTNHVLERLDRAAATHALERLREALAARLSDDGVWFDSSAWIITAIPSLSSDTALDGVDDSGEVPTVVRRADALVPRGARYCNALVALLLS